VKRGTLSRIVAVLIVSAPLSVWFHRADRRDREMIAAHRGDEILRERNKGPETPVGTYFLLVSFVGFTTGAVEGVAWTIRAALGSVDARRARRAPAGPLPVAGAAHLPSASSASPADGHSPMEVIYVPPAGGGAAECMPPSPAPPPQAGAGS
jgi:hypothetical protein